MANLLYDTFKEGLLNKLFDMDTDVQNAALIDGDDYTFSAAHDSYDNTPTGDVPAAAKVANFVLGTLSITNGVFDSADFTWASVSGDQSEEIILWDDTPANNQLVANYDTGMSGMPVTPNGGDINVTVNGSGWFSL